MGVLSYLKRLFGKKFSKSVEPVVHSEEIVKAVDLSNEKESNSEITIETIEVLEGLAPGSLTKTKVKLSDKETENKETEENTKPSKKSTSKKKK